MPKGRSNEVACNKRYQAIDIRQLGLDYEWFLRKEVVLGAPLEFKYVDSDSKGRKINPPQDPECERQIGIMDIEKNKELILG